MSDISFDTIYDLACQRKGGEDQVKHQLLANTFSAPVIQTPLSQLGDDRVLSEFSKKVFISGFVWRVVESKWDNFEELFWGFDIEKLLMMPDEMLEAKARDVRIIRHLKKCWAIRENARMMHQTTLREGISFAAFIDSWPSDNIIELWSYLKKHGMRLGGNTGPYALRAIGKDTFLLTRDVEGYLRSAGIIDTGITTKSALRNSQHFFNDLQQQSGWNYRDLSLLLANSHGENNIIV
ncbi:MAG: DNA-3-methyladenine glycosylase I [Sinobacterium sp.]|nr:DNA-3-methyladenine glycosylase I [Sinobacterium sp.]